ncbi:kinase-like protein [Gymnopus androsaceus JB14]|uniref:Kinase-like protein n=1 Tax=Gymnopus androsaceus JB14 TaxID=1447944 RepID=A0A6A4ID27_9AGAR|nr:kinase-like protein [Gymnopus androsaceus JB14]
MPFYENGTIIEFLKQRPHSEVDRKRMILEIALGMAFLHQNGLVHGQLRPSNIFVSPDGHATVAEYDTLQTNKNPEAHRYLSPEGWKGTVSRPSDVYAFAMCALEIFTSILPWGGLSEKHIYYLVVIEKSRPDRPDEVLLTDDIWNIIVSAWAEEPRSRPSFDLISRLWRGAISQFATPSVSNSPLHRPLRRQTLRHLSVISNGSGPPAYEDSRVVPVPASAPPSTHSFSSAETIRERIEPIHGYSWYSESEGQETMAAHPAECFPSPSSHSPAI